MYVGKAKGGGGTPKVLLTETLRKPSGLGSGNWVCAALNTELTDFFFLPLVVGGGDPGGGGWGWVHALDVRTLLSLPIPQLPPGGFAPLAALPLHPAPKVVASFASPSPPPPFW